MCEVHGADKSTGRPTDEYFRYQGKLVFICSIEVLKPNFRISTAVIITCRLSIDDSVSVILYNI